MSTTRFRRRIARVERRSTTCSLTGGARKSSSCGLAACQVSERSPAGGPAGGISTDLLGGEDEERQKFEGALARARTDQGRCRDTLAEPRRVPAQDGVGLGAMLGPPQLPGQMEISRDHPC